MPRNDDVISLTDPGRKRLATALKRIRRETGVRVVDFTTRPGYDVNMFLDADHLTLFRGRRHFSTELARYYEDDPLLNNSTYRTASLDNSGAVSSTQ